MQVNGRTNIYLKTLIRPPRATKHRWYRL